MITEHDLQEAIAECEGTRNPNANTCLKLASYYTIMNHLYGEKDEGPKYSFAMGTTPVDNERPRIESDSESEFSQLINGMYIDDVLPVLDELMETLRLLNPRLYAGVMRKIAG